MRDRRSGIMLGHFVAIGVILLAGLGLKIWIDNRQPQLSQAVFPEVSYKISDWQGRDLSMDEEVLNLLMPDKLIFRRYANPNGAYGDLYMVYYMAQTTQKTFHSPLNCYPGSGWQILENRRVSLRGIQKEGPSVSAKRIVIQKGLSKRLVYFWYYAGGQIASNQFMNKWLTIKNTLIKGRGDGGLITISTEFGPNSTIPEVFERDFVPQVIDILNRKAPKKRP